MENIESYYEEYENPKNRNISSSVPSKIKYLEKCIENLEKLSQDPDIPDYALEYYKRAIKEFKDRIENLKNGRPEFGHKNSTEEELYQSEADEELYQSEADEELYLEQKKK